MSDADDLQDLHRADDLAATVRALAQRVDALEDQVALYQLVASYGPAVDTGSGEVAAELWTEDGTFEVPGLFTMRGREQLAGMVHSDNNKALIANGAGHVLTAPHIEFDGDRAHGRSYSLHIVYDAEAEQWVVKRLSANTWDWVRTPEGWKTEHRVNANLDGTPAHAEILAP